MGRFETVKKSSQNGPLQVARAAIGHLSTSMVAGLRIHDNGCGDGNVSRALLEGLPRDEWPARIDATDISLAGPALDRLQADSTTNDWPVHTSVVSALNLSVFAEETFEASVANCVIYRFPDSDARQAAREMCRTLKPNGIAIASGFGYTAHRAALAAAHYGTRPDKTGPLVGGAVRWEDGTLLEATMRQGGFSEVDMHMIETTTVVEDLREWEYNMWATLGRPAAGWLESDELKWDEALSIFDAMLRKQPGFQILESESGAPERAQLINQAWIAVAKK